jgi:hypothetical protein
MLRLAGDNGHALQPEFPRAAIKKVGAEAAWFDKGYLADTGDCKDDARKTRPTPDIKPIGSRGGVIKELERVFDMPRPDVHRAGATDQILPSIFLEEKSYELLQLLLRFT